VPDTWSLGIIITVAIAVFLYGFSKTAMPAAGVLGGAVLAAVLTPLVASGFVVPLLVFGDLFGLALYRQHANWRLIRRLVPGVLAGFVIVAILFRVLDTVTLARVIGALILVSVVLEIWRLRRGVQLDDDTGGHGSRVAAGFFGTLAGMTTMGANAGGAAMTLYLVHMRVPTLAFMGTSTWFFFILNVSKIPFVVALGALTWDSLLLNLWFAPLIVIGALLGARAFRRMSPAFFVYTALALSGVAACWLLIRG
jgi:uncharacterized membrane protein YfcA